MTHDINSSKTLRFTHDTKPASDVQAGTVRVNVRPEYASVEVIQEDGHASTAIVSREQILALAASIEAEVTR